MPIRAADFLALARAAQSKIAALFSTSGLAFRAAVPLGADFICFAAFVTTRRYAAFVVAFARALLADLTVVTAYRGRRGEAALLAGLAADAPAPVRYRANVFALRAAETAVWRRAELCLLVAAGLSAFRLYIAAFPFFPTLITAAELIGRAAALAGPALRRAGTAEALTELSATLIYAAEPRPVGNAALVIFRIVAAAVVIRFFTRPRDATRRGPRASATGHLCRTTSSGCDRLCGLR